MPAVQSKVNFENNPVPENDKLKTKCAAKSKIKDRSTSRKSEIPLEPNVKHKKKVFVPELDLKSVAPRSQDKRKTKTVPSTRESATKQLKCTGLKPCVPIVPSSDSCLSEMESSRSLFHVSIADVKNLSPNYIPDNYFDCNEVDEFFRTQYRDLDNSSDFGYDTPTLLPMTSLDAKNSPGILRHFKDFLQQEETSKTNLLKPTEIALLNDIVKADERHRRLRRDDCELLREILTGHLKEISQKERVIKIALKKIRNRHDGEVEVTTLKVDTAEKPMECAQKSERPKIAGPTPREDYELMMKGPTSVRSSRKSQELDVIFKNVPSLEREIRILRSLGMKLEETLKKSTEKCPSNRVLVLHEVQRRSLARSLHFSCILGTIRGVQVVSGKAQEFQIRHQTIDELKLERDFFIPTDIENFTLQRMDFNKLSSNPELLLRRLRPFTKGSTMKFNFIEQDPMFFNHFLNKLCNIYSETSESHGIFIPQGLELERSTNQSELLLHKNGSGDHPDAEERKGKPHQNLELGMQKPQTSSNSSLIKKRKKKHFITPMPSQNVPPTKNRLIRNILFGTLQFTMLFTLATAIWYPDMACL